MKPLALILPALIAAAPAVARTEVAAYKAVGTEPFWSLEIDDERMTFRGIDKRPVSVPAPEAIVGINGERYVTRGMTVHVTHTQCSDGMSDRRFADTVRVTIGRRTYDGCGGTVLTMPDAGLLVGSRWSIGLLDDKPLKLRRPATVSFDATRISGRICNGFSGTYRFWQGTLAAGPLMGTKMACADGSTAVETRVIRILSQPLKVSQGARSVRLSSGRSSITLRPLR